MIERYSWRRVRTSIVRERSEQPYFMRDGNDVASLVRQFLQEDTRERFVAVYLDARHKTIAIYDAAIGSPESCTVDMRNIFGPAMSLSATAIVVAHNHPTGDPTPSQEDRNVTERIKDASKILGISFLDHIIIGDSSFFSFVDQTLHTYIIKKDIIGV